MTLADYLAREALSDRAFARRADVSLEYVRRLREGDRARNARTALRVAEATGGEVSAAELLGLPPEPKRARTAGRGA